MKKCLLALAIITSVFSFAEEKSVADKATNKALDIGFNAISGFLSGKSGEQITKEAKDQAIDSTKEIASDSLENAKNEAKK
ncbi:MAG: hypothetical protein SOW25_03915 [Helicobacter sp.]|nr:hypothetical protein [Helicobacteraceae bacterium]MDY3113457.1 hypothetical protein [Helicobacter sp.]